MSLYIMLSTLSESGRRVLRDRPGWIRKVNADVRRMGARVMLSHLAQYPDSCSINATKYLRHGYGQRLWPTFLDALETHPAALNDPQSVVQGAQIAFGMFESALVPIVSTAAE